MNCSICRKEIDLNNSGIKTFYLEERETVYGEHSIYQQLIKYNSVCSVDCLKTLVVRRGEQP